MTSSHNLFYAGGRDRKYKNLYINPVLYFSPSVRKLPCLKRFQPHSVIRRGKARRLYSDRSNRHPFSLVSFIKHEELLRSCIIYARKFSSLFNKLRIYLNPFLTHVQGARTLMLSMSAHTPVLVLPSCSTS